LHNILNFGLKNWFVFKTIDGILCCKP